MGSEHYQVSARREIWQKVDERFEPIGYYKNGFVTSDCCFLFNEATETDIKMVKLMVEMAEERCHGDKADDAGADMVKPSRLPEASKPSKEAGDGNHG